MAGVLFERSRGGWPSVRANPGSHAGQPVSAAIFLKFIFMLPFPFIMYLKEGTSHIDEHSLQKGQIFVKG